jgi:DNA polymerase III sliding clamp (beta) subunit (PCNA family)
LSGYTDRGPAYRRGFLHRVRTSYQPALLTNEESKGVRLSFADDKLTLTSRAPEMGEADTGKVVVELKSATKPGVLKTGSDFTYAIMPINLQ